MSLEFLENNNIDLSWINDPDGYEEIAEEADAYRTKGKNNNEVKLIKDFITKIDNGSVSKNNAGNEFRKLKQKVANDILRQDLIKYLENICLEKILNQKKNMKKV